MTRTEERRIKLQKVRSWMQRAGLDIVFLTSRANFAWLTAGGRNHVNTATAEGVTTLAVTVEKCYCLASAIEAPRMMAEELSADEFELIDFPWHAPKERRRAFLDLAAGKRAASDVPLYDLPLLGGDFAELRYSLTPGEVARYRKLGRDVSALMETVGRAIRVGERECEVEGLMAELALAQGIRPLVRLVAADSRIEKFRHPIPTDRKIRKRVMYILCGERHGLVGVATRLVNFTKPAAVLRRRHEAACRIDGTLILATQVGRAVGEVLQAGLEAYEREGFPDEWRLHHQGGPTGYLAREYIATAGDKRQVLPNQAFAWNPSITGTKSEDTILATEKGPVLLTHPLDWPTVEVEFAGQTIRRADILVR